MILQQSGLAKANLLHMYNKGLSRATDSPVHMVNFFVVPLRYRSGRAETGAILRLMGGISPASRATRVASRFRGWSVGAFGPGDPQTPGRVGESFLPVEGRKGDDQPALAAQRDRAGQQLQLMSQVRADIGHIDLLLFGDRRQRLGNWSQGRQRNKHRGTRIRATKEGRSRCEAGALQWLTSAAGGQNEKLSIRWV